MTSKKILITIDVEDWFQVENLRHYFPPDQWDRYPLRVERNTHRLLDLFDAFDTVSVKATFFVLGWVARRIPGLVKEIHSRGHEIASHGYGHTMCNRIEERVLEQDLIRSKHLLEDIVGIEIMGYRAPNFSVNDKVLKAIQRAGYHYDSSYNDFSMHGRYGRLDMDNGRKIGIMTCFNDGFCEIPVSNIGIDRHVLPWAGGGYFRLIPFPIFKVGIQYILNKRDAYMFYLHPWEIDPDQPRVKQAKFVQSWRHYLNLEHTFHKLRQMISSLKQYGFITCSRYIENTKKSLVE